MWCDCHIKRCAACGQPYRGIHIIRYYARPVQHHRINSHAQDGSPCSLTTLALFFNFLKVRAVQIHNYRQCHLIAYQRAPRQQSRETRRGWSPPVNACVSLLSIFYVCVFGTYTLSLDGSVKFQIKPYLDVRAARTACILSASSVNQAKALARNKDMSQAPHKSKFHTYLTFLFISTFVAADRVIDS